MNADRIRALLRYDPETGKFHWRTGREAGTVISEDGRRGITIERRRYPSARLAWLIMTGEWPVNEIDHKDRDSSNDAWENLREASRTQNLANRKIMSNSRSGLKGIYKNRNGTTWNARIRVNGKRLYVGNFPTADAAHQAYCAAAREHYGEFARVA